MRRIVLASALVVLGACGGTGGAEVPFSIVVETQGTDGFDTDTGWRVQLDEARLNVSAIYLWENPPALARLWNLLVPVAHAHAGDLQFAGGAALGEHLGLTTFDLLAGPTNLGERIGNEGRVQSFSVLLDPIDGHVAKVRGTATREGVTVDFTGGLALDAGRQRRVDGLRTDGELTSGSTFVVTVNVARWFQDADFSTLDDGVIAPSTQARAAWFLGARGSDSFTGSWR